MSTKPGNLWEPPDELPGMTPTCEPVYEVGEAICYTERAAPKTTEPAPWCGTFGPPLPPLEKDFTSPGVITRRFWGGPNAGWLYAVTLELPYHGKAGVITGEHGLARRKAGDA